MSHFGRDPPPYPGHLKHLYQPGYRQSYSGSETSTDPSLSSTENLSARLDPQGEESSYQKVIHNHLLDTTDDDYSYSILARLGMPVTSVEVRASNSSTFYVTGSRSQQMVVSTTMDPGLNNSLQRWNNSPEQSVSIPANQRLANVYKYKDVNTRTAQMAPAVEPPYHERPPPEYPGLKVTEELKSSYEALDNPETILPTSGPHSDLKKAIIRETKQTNVYVNDIKSQVQHFTSKAQTMEPDYAAIARAQQMVEMLSRENDKLREENESYYKKVAKLQKFEIEIQKVHDSYRVLVQSSQKRENLEKAMRMRLEAELKKLLDANLVLKEKCEKPRKETFSQGETDLKKELSRKDAVINKLMQLNKDMCATRERQEIEMNALRQTLEEQRKSIDALETAFARAQKNVTLLTEECRKKQIYAERVDQLQEALQSLQSAGEKRDHLEKQLRGKLEKEIEILRAQMAGQDSQQTDKSEQTMPTLKRALREKEEKILELESEIAKWEQKYLEETAMRQLAIDAVSTPKEARIAALEQCSVESEKMIAEATMEKLKQMEEVYTANRRCAELEARLKSQQAQLAEKDAMIRVLSRHSSKLSGSSSSLLSSPRHSPHSSISSTHATSTPTSRQNSNLDLEFRDPRMVSHSRSASLGDNHKRSASVGDSAKERKDSVPAVTVSVTKPSEDTKKPTEHVSSHFWQV